MTDIVASVVPSSYAIRDDRGRLIADDGLPVSGLCSVQEACAVLSLSQSAVYQMLAAGQIASRRFGRSRRIPWSEVRRLLAVDSAE